MDTRPPHQPTFQSLPEPDLPVEDEKLLVNLFSRHTPTVQQLLAMEKVDLAALEYARVIMANVPRSADRTHALRQLRDAKMWANTGIMYKGASLS